MPTPDEYRSLKAAGVCVDCRAQGARGGRIRCAECASRAARVQRRLRAQRIASGLCGTCGAHPPAPGQYKCPDCSASAAAWGKSTGWRHQRQRALGLTILHDGTITQKSKDALLAEHEGCCAICRLPVDELLPATDPMSLAWDHIVPVKDGGAHSILNLRPTHRRCNGRKGARDPFEGLEAA